MIGMPSLSIIIVSFNTKEITYQCLQSLLASLKRSPSLEAEIIVVDNGSEDGSVIMLESFGKAITLIRNGKNRGYTQANNLGIKKARGTHVLFLNSDVIIENVDFQKIISLMREHKDIGGLTVKVLLANGMIDPASHRGFPNPWNSFCYFSGLERVFGKAPILGRLFGGYHLTYRNLIEPHDIDSPTGAFFLTKKYILRDLGGFDEAFFMYGEDLDLALRIKEKGCRIVYYPFCSVTHIKYASGLGNKNKDVQKKMKEQFYESMKIFYVKHYEHRYPWLLNHMIYFAIEFKKRFT